MGSIGILKSLGIIIPIVLVLVFIITQIAIIRVPEDQIAYISGFWKREISGKVGFYFRMFERVDRLYLGMVSVDVRTSRALPTKDYINIMVDAVVNIEVDQSDKKYKQLAAKNFLNLNADSIGAKITPLLEGNLREIIGMNNLTELVENRKKFNEDVSINIAPDLQNLGLKILSFNVQSFNDEKGVIDDLGIENTVAISKKAKIARAEADKEVLMKEALTKKEAAIAQSENLRAAKESEIQNLQIIAERENAFILKQAELKKESDIQKAEADLAYETQKQLKRKELEQAEGEANFAKEEVNIKTQKAILEAKLKNEQEIKANAELYARQKEAEALYAEESKRAEVELLKKQKEMEAIELEARTRAAALKLQAEAEAEAIKLKAIAEAESKEKIGEAEARAIEAKLRAEAEGKKQALLAEAEGLDKKAEAMKKYGEGAILEMYFKALPEVAKNVATPLNNVDKITMYGEGNGSKMISDITQMIGKVNDGVSDSTGIDLKSLIAGYLGKGFVEKLGNNNNNSNYNNIDNTNNNTNNSNVTGNTDNFVENKNNNI